MKDTTRIKLPSEVIQEEEGVISTTASVAVVDKPLGKKQYGYFYERYRDWEKGCEYPDIQQAANLMWNFEAKLFKKQYGYFCGGT